jgi:hypothetical protein
LLLRQTRARLERVLNSPAGPLAKRLKKCRAIGLLGRRADPIVEKFGILADVMSDKPENDPVTDVAYHPENCPKKDAEDYNVGYRRPPKHSQFQPGRSGNPRGRPKREESLRDLIKADLNKIVSVQENGKTRTMTLHSLHSHLCAPAAHSRRQVGFIAFVYRSVDRDRYRDKALRAYCP